MTRPWSARLRATATVLVGAALLLPHAAAPVPALASTTGTAPAASVADAATYGPRTGTGCFDDGASGKRVQAVYVVSSDKPDRYSQVLATLRTALAEVDDTLVASSLRNGIPDGGTARQVRWVHDAACLPKIAKVVVPPQRDATGAVTKRVDGKSYADTITLVTGMGTVDGVDLNNAERKYVLLVDSDTTTSGSFCGHGNFSPDTRFGQDNPNNTGRTYARVDALCWPGTLDPHNYAKHSVVAHELMHTLGSVLPGAPNGAGQHCVDNADNLCYDDGMAATKGGMRNVCPPSEEWLFDCGGDDYFHTAPKADNWLATHWNTANSAFLATPPAPAGTHSLAPFVPGLPTAWTVTPTVKSGQGYNVKYAITVSTGVDPSRPCVLDRASSLSGTAAGASVLCPAGAASVTVAPTITQQDGRSTPLSPLRVYNVSAARDAAVTVTPATATVTAGDTVAVTAKVTDPASGQPLYGVPVQLSADGLSARLLTDRTGLAQTTFTAARSTAITAQTEPAGPWQPATATGQVQAMTRTGLSLDAPAASAVEGAAVTFTGQLRDAAGTPLPGQPVQLWRSTGTWEPVADGTTDDTGAVALGATVTDTARYQLRFAGAGDYLPASSGEASITATRTATLTGAVSAPVVATGDPVTVTARLSDRAGAVPGAALDLWFHDEQGWSVLEQQQTGTDGAATFTAVPEHTGTFQVRFAGTGTHTPATSAELTVAVRARTTLALAGPRTAPAGSPVTLTATLKESGSAVPGQPVTLWDVTRPEAPAAVETVSTGADGTATFTRTAGAATAYEARYAGDEVRAPASSGPLTVTGSYATTLTTTSAAAGVGYGASTTVSGALSAAGVGPLPGEPVELWAGAPGASPTRLATGATSSTGTVTFPVTPTAATAYFIGYSGRGPYTNTYGPSVTVTVTRATAAVLTAPTSTPYGGAATLTTTLTWAGTTLGLAGQPVELWTTAATPARVGTATTDSLGKATFTLTARSSGSYQVRYAGKMIAGVTAQPATSATRAITVVRAVTAHATVSTTRVTYGAYSKVTGSVTWSGTTSRLAGQPVELWGYGRGAWARVGTGTTSATGYVTWTVRPLFSTTYQVRYAGNRSVSGVTTGAAASANATTKVLSKVSLTTPTSVRYYNTYTLTGYVYPSTSGRVVSLVVDGSVKAKVSTDRYGKFAFRYKFAKGYRSVKAYLATSSYSDGAYSPTYTVRSY